MRENEFFLGLIAGFLLSLGGVTARGYRSSYANDQYNCEEENGDYHLPVPIVTQPARFRQIKPSCGYYEVPEEPTPEKYYVKYSSPKKCYPTSPYKKEISRFYQVLQPVDRYYDQQQCPALPPPVAPGVANKKSPAIQIYVV